MVARGRTDAVTTAYYVDFINYYLYPSEAADDVEGLLVHKRDKVTSKANLWRHRLSRLVLFSKQYTSGEASI